MPIPRQWINDQRLRCYNECGASSSSISNGPKKTRVRMNKTDDRAGAGGPGIGGKGRLEVERL